MRTSNNTPTSSNNAVPLSPTMISRPVSVPASISSESLPPPVEAEVTHHGPQPGGECRRAVSLEPTQPPEPIPFQLLADEKEAIVHAVGMNVGLPKRETAPANENHDKLDAMLDSLDDLDL